MTLGNLHEHNTIINIIRVILITTFTLGMMSSLTSFKFHVKKVLLLFGVYLLWIGVSTGVLLYFAGFFCLYPLYVFYHFRAGYRARLLYGLQLSRPVRI